ncbi:endo-1,3-beta glucanase [Emydomyces testavorans]|uniref:Glucan endo-1,3-beta-D-glucosidase 1 n=1 Tax=Emydomyces testavorans TaxID=2070801 RepID=A0AAF0DGY1_9EURO|nr:endo-1,3-beta glucanase [Emydomyces testavorans]
MIQRMTIWLTTTILISFGIITSVQSHPYPLSVEGSPKASFRTHPAQDWTKHLPATHSEKLGSSNSYAFGGVRPPTLLLPTPVQQPWTHPAPTQTNLSSGKVRLHPSNSQSQDFSTTRSFRSTKTASTTPYRFPPEPRVPTSRFTTHPQSSHGYFNTSLSTIPITSSETGRSKDATTSITSSSGAPKSSTATVASTAPCAMQSSMCSQDVFLPVSRDPIPSNVPQRGDHPVPKNHIVNAPGPVSTNKFYANFFLDAQNNYSLTHPYSVGWSKGVDPTKSFGLAISHVDASQRVLGERTSSIPGNPARYYINPVGIQSIILSATEFGNSTSLSVSNPQAFSANVLLTPQQGSNASITIPLVQGMGFVTGIYDNLQPAIQSAVFFRQVNAVAGPRDGIFKYKATLENSTTWLLYITPANGADPKLELISNNTLRGPSGFKGIIQVAKDPGNGESLYDRSAGVYPTAVNITGSVSGTTGTYGLSWTKDGKDANNTPLLMFALPHHVESFDDASRQRQTNLKLQTTTKGLATACVGDSWTMIEANLPISMDFEPWRPFMSSAPSLSPAIKQTIQAVAPSELSQDMNAQTNLDSMYFSGKALGKFAGVVYTVQELLQDPDLASGALKTLKECFARFVENKQQYPLVYDTVWKGVVSSGAYTTGNIYLDFGNALYNDHHFHYGYFILAAAIIGRLDQSWLAANKAWVNMLVRDASNPVSDELFPFSRGFDWYNGHSWAKGLFASIDGKDQESTSEDTMFAYAIKMWGKTTGDTSMEARGNLMLGILSRSLNSYFLMRSDNVNQPKEFVPNKVTGIVSDAPCYELLLILMSGLQLFENKCDHATYFGSNLEYIQGIHMLPLLPASAYIRRQDFVREEWNAMFASNATKPADTVDGGWRGILYANLAIIDPVASWNFFAQPNFNMDWIDGGASRTWYLAYAAYLGGGSI